MRSWHLNRWFWFIFIQENKDLSLLLLNSTKIVGKAILSNMVIGEEPTIIKAGTDLSLLVSKQFTSKISGMMLQSSDASFTFPNDSTGIFGNTSIVNSQVVNLQLF